VVSGKRSAHGDSLELGLEDWRVRPPEIPVKRRRVDTETQPRVRIGGRAGIPSSQLMEKPTC